MKLQHHRLSRRETQIMEVLYAEEELSVNELQERLPDPPTPMAIRAALKILGEKGLIKRRKVNRGYAYRPKETRSRIGRDRLKNVVQVFFEGSIEKAVGAYLAGTRSRLSPEERRRLKELIDQSEETKD